MRMIFGALALLVVLAIIGLQARNQVETVAKPIQMPMPDGTTQSVNPKQIEQQYKKALEDAMNKARARSADE